MTSQHYVLRVTDIFASGRTNGEKQTAAYKHTHYTRDAKVQVSYYDDSCISEKKRKQGSDLFLSNPQRRFVAVKGTLLQNFEHDCA